MDNSYTLCIIKPNKSSFSETFIQAHIDGLAGKKLVLYGGAFPVYDNDGQPLIKSKWKILSYLIQKKLFNKLDIKVRIHALSHYFKTRKVDVVLAEYGMVGAMVTEACQLANVPLVVHFHGADAYHKETINLYNEFYQKAFKYAGAIVAVSADMAKRLKELGAPADKIVLNPYGVDTTKFTIADVASSGIVFLAVGRFVSKKAPTSVVQAFKVVTERFPDAHLWMVGDGPLLTTTKQFANNLKLADKITFTGVLSPAEIQELMQRTRCFVQHSVTAPDGDMEGTPNTILEASASGLPIVSTLHAGIKEAVINGETGYLVPEHDIAGMAAGMIKLAGSPNLAVKLGEAGRQHMLKNYNINTQIALLDSIIQKSIVNKI